MSEFKQIAPRLYQAHLEARCQMLDDEIVRVKHLGEFTQVNTLLDAAQQGFDAANWTGSAEDQNRWSKEVTDLKTKRRMLLHRGPQYRDLFA